jgi:hypothetical protein
MCADYTIDEDHFFPLFNHQHENPEIYSSVCPPYSLVLWTLKSRLK